MTHDTASLAIAEELAVYLQGANPGWTHEPVPDAVVPAVVSEPKVPCVCGASDCAERDDDGSIRVGDQVQDLLDGRDGHWMTVTSVSEGFVCVDGFPVARREMTRDMAEGRVEWRRGEVGS